ncbi:MAG: GntR family transcriptional regulator [Chloroflexota bacterium]|nr:GntR family transcriptional regulator [Chloroflexota bacterium]
MSPFNSTQPAPIGLQVADQIRRRIVLGDFRGGERLPSQRRMAAALGVSLPTLQAALTALRHAGLVESRHGVGTFVARRRRPIRLAAIELHRANSLELHQLRADLELAAIRRAARLRTPVQLRKLGAAWSELARALHGAEGDLIAIADLDFHRLLVVAGSTELVATIHDGIAMRLRADLAGRAFEWTANAPAEDHRAVLAALEGGEGRRAHALLAGILRREAPSRLDV